MEVQDTEHLAHPQDTEHLASLEKKLDLLRDLVTAVARGYKTGLFVYGSGGIGKSYTVLTHLQKLDIAYKLWNSRITAKGLFLGLFEAPDMVHVLEDVERLTKDADAQGVLRSACWAQPGHDRVVTWTTAKDPQAFSFRSGIIMISNRRLSGLPELQALATRIEVHRFEVTEAEIAALMRQLASEGFPYQGKKALDSAECFDVTEHLLKQCRAAGCPLDLRLQQKAFLTYLQHKHDCSVTHWHDLIAAMVREATPRFQHESNHDSPEDRYKHRRNILRRIMAETENVGEQEKRYKEETGYSRVDFYRIKKQIVNGEFDDFDAAV
jgi:hypothetical protein